MTPERYQQVTELLDAALEVPTADRAAFLGRACEGDEELRGEVESLLAARSGVLDAPAPEIAGDSTVTEVAAGSELGPYRIEGALGAGGMGRVYRAVDTRLGRKVAVKISAKEFTDRFQREARAISALNHPHICTLYDVGPNYLVMELVEGETLAARLKKGKLSLDDALLYGGQIAAALAEAHSKGITHRDLKPGNVMIGKNGVKVLDFGLAKVAPASAGESLTVSQAIMGTPAYMAPEQREGKECDARTDIYALGLVIREMATDLPPHVAHVAERCLANDPGERWQAASDVRRELEWAATSPATRSPVPRAPLGWIAAGVLLLALGIVTFFYFRPAPLRPLIHVNAEIAADTPLATGGAGGGMLALSPDGARLALTMRGADGKVRLYTRLLDQNQVTPLAGTENAFGPFFSPDGEWIGFFADSKLKKISAGGGATVTLCDAPAPRGASWGDEGNIVAALDGLSGLSRIPSSGGTPVPLTKLNPGELTHRFPQVLPGSQAVLFTVSTQQGNYDNANIDVVSLKTSGRKTVQRGGFSPRYLATSKRTGHLIYQHESTLFAVPFDPGRLALAGVPTPILEDVSGGGAGGGDFAFSGAPSVPGTFVYLARKAAQASWPISWLDSAGKTEPLHAPISGYFSPRFSPDGKRLAFSMGNGSGTDIWVKDLDRDTPFRLTFLAGGNRWPVWTPNGKNIVLQSTNPAAPGLYWVRSEGSGEAQRLTDGKLNEQPYSFSPDGKRLAFSGAGNGGSQDIFTAPIEGDPVRIGKAELFLGTPFLERYPAFSPDGRWLAYASNASGPIEVYVRPFPGPGGRWQISTGGGSFPVWSRDGRELVYETLDGRVMAVSYTVKGDSFAADKPRVWAENRLQNIGVNSNYDLAPGGKRLAAMLAGDEATHLTFLLNFFDELRRRVPPGGK
jgi:Tol biopolymer transport system component/predicted Ser/Thr protein kinase